MLFISMGVQTQMQAQQMAQFGHGRPAEVLSFDFIALARGTLEARE